ncbi:MAG TPA: hypothetical protein VHA37_08210 [Candidatus Saccharimonadales bacterium]|nr:hypothetical protein [Candidatus Saccharimonadales bacterium]
MSDEPAGVSQGAIQAQPAPQQQSESEQQQAAEEYSQAAQAAGGNQPKMRVKVHSPFRDYYDGMAFSISGENATGPFDILPKHHSFISLLMPGDLVIRTVSKGDQRIRISSGIMHVKADEIIVFLDV